jgi:outer membrane protein assembly factor BamA
MFCTAPTAMLAQSTEDSVKTAHDSIMKYLFRKSNNIVDKKDTAKTKPAVIKTNADSLKTAKDTTRKVVPVATVIPANHFSLEIISLQDKDLLLKIPYKKAFTTKGEREKEMQSVKFFCFDNAYLTATYDSLVNDSTHLKAYLNFGKQYKWATLKKGNVDENVLSSIGFHEKLYHNKPIYFKNVKVIQEKIVDYYENNGYPFASVRLDSIDIKDDNISAQLHVTKNQLEKIDSVIVKGNANISNAFLYNYLGVKPGSIYNEAQLKKVNTRLAELPFLRALKPAKIDFTDKATKLILNLEKKRSSQFDGILGVLPDAVTGKVLFTGDVNLKLQNGLGHGELIDLTWRRLQTQTQDLKLHLVYPFILRTPFGIDYTFKLYKKDTTYLDLNQNVGIQYLLKGGNYIKIFYNNKSSTLLSTSGLANLTTLPPYGDVHTNMYGLGLKYEKLDYRLNPRKGYSLLMNGSVGEKVIKKISKFNQDVYTNLKLNSTVYNGDFDGSVFLPIANRSTVKVGGKAAFMYGENTFQNELYRFGGLKTLRGFDEESIYASTYTILSLEYRYLLEQNSYIYLFGDKAWYEKAYVGDYFNDSPYGFGAGVSFETKAGIFSINYALGSEQNNQISLRSGKIHFGIVNYF